MFSERLSRRWRRSLPGLVALVLLALSATATATSASAAPSSSPSASPSPSGETPATTNTFGLGPATASKVDPSRGYYQFFSQPGSEATDHVAVVNLSDRPLTLNVYAADATNGTNGAFGYRNRADKNTDAGSWVFVATPGGTGQVTVPAVTTIILPIEVIVPKTASPGDHTAGLIVSSDAAISGKNTSKAVLEQRVAAKVFIRVSGPIHPELAVQNLHASYHGTISPLGKGSVGVSFTVHNSGNVNLGGRQRVTITGLFGGDRTISSLVDVPLLLPGGSYRQTLTVPGVRPQVLMVGKVSVTPLPPPGDDDPNLHVASASTHFWAIPWTLLAIVVVLLLALGYLVWRRFRGKRSGGGRHGRGNGGSAKSEPLVSV